MIFREKCIQPDGTQYSRYEMEKKLAISHVVVVNSSSEVLPIGSVFNTIESTQKVCYNLESSKDILDSNILNGTRIIRESLIALAGALQMKRYSNPSCYL